MCFHMILNDIHLPCCHLVKTPPHDIPINFYAHVPINTQIMTTVHMKITLTILKMRHHYMKIYVRKLFTG